MAHTFKKVHSTCTAKHFCHNSYIFRVITYLLMDEVFHELPLKHISKCNPWGLNFEYWIFFIKEYLQAYNLKKKTNSIQCIKFSAFFSLHTSIWKRLQRISIKVKKIIWALYKSNFFIMIRNATFSTMNIIFLNETRKVIFKCIFLGEDRLCFSSQKPNVKFLGKNLYWIYKKYYISMYF